LMKLVSIKTR